MKNKICFNNQGFTSKEEHKTDATFNTFISSMYNEESLK